MVLLGDAVLPHPRMDFFVAAFTVEFCPKVCLPTLLCCDPPTSHEGWVVTDMLPMATRKVGHPVPFFVLMIPNDALLHRPAISMRNILV